MAQTLSRTPIHGGQRELEELEELEEAAAEAPEAVEMVGQGFACWCNGTRSLN